MAIFRLADLKIYDILGYMVENKIRNTILNKNLVKRDEHIIVGLSGGPDSVCLFHALLQMSKELNFTLSAVHINHKFRPGEAEEDQAYVEELCRQKDVPCYSYVYDCNKVAEERGIGSEEAGRLVRYQAFYDAAQKIMDGVEGRWYKPEQIKIAVAHNQNDQAETLLMRILRGTGTDGLSGIEYSRSGELGTTVIRPLLEVSRKEIEAYCDENNLNPRIDNTNSEPIYTRNKIRLQLIPMLEENFNVNVIDSLNRLSKIASEDKDYFDMQVEEIMEQAAMMVNDNPQKTEVSRIGALSFSLSQMNAMHPAIRHRVVRRAFESIGLDQGITAAHIEAVDRIIGGNSDSARTDFPRGYAAAVSYGEVRFYRNDPISLGYVSSNELKSKLVIRIVMNDKKLKDLSKNGTKRYAALDLNKVLERLWQKDNPYLEEIEEAEAAEKDKDFCQQLEAELAVMLQIRTRRQGDWMIPLGMSGRKKLQDMFVDEKVYKECRDKVPAVCIGDEVIWLIGDDVSGYNTGMRRGRISENYKLDNDTKDIVLLEFLEKL